MPFIHIYSHRKPLNFKDLEPLGHQILSDWFGRPLEASVCFCFAIHEGRLHFMVRSDLGRGMSHPESKASRYQAELWKYDVAEFFLSDPVTGHYLEFNLSPNGSWWTCGFSGVLQAAHEEPSPVPGVETHGEQHEGFWQGHASLPMDWLEEHYHFGKDTRLNATFILNSPDQIFLTAAPPTKGEPAFHQPDHFCPVEFVSLA